MTVWLEASLQRCNEKLAAATKAQGGLRRYPLESFKVCLCSPELKPKLTLENVQETLEKSSPRTQARTLPGCVFHYQCGFATSAPVGEWH